MTDPLGAPIPPGYRVRTPTRDDLPAIAAVIAASDIHDVGAADFSREQLEESWRSGEVDPANAWLVEDAAGAAAAYLQMELHPGHLADAVGGVHPEHRGRGLGRLILRLSERRARELRSVRDTSVSKALANWIMHGTEDARRLLLDEGYRHARSFFRMAITLEQPPPAPDWPVGVRVRTFRPGEDDRPTYEAMEEAFEDHWGHARAEFEEWRRRRIETPHFDPSLWHLALADGRVVGASLCAVVGDENWVSTLGVVREWRGRGLGMALLRHSFAEFHRRGRRRVVLGVDAENPTGATRLYERAGMHVERQYDRYEKELG